MKKVLIAAVLVLAATLAAAQQGNLGSEFQREFSDLGSCFKKPAGCAQTVVMGKPLHLAFGSIAPQNGFSAGPAFTHEVNTSDAVVSTNQSWRAGFYLKAYDTSNYWVGRKTQPVLNFYSEAVSLNKLIFYGLGPLSSNSNQTFYGETQTISGANAIIPVKGPFSVYGELNFRTVDIRGRHGDNRPSIEQVFSETAAPGLTTQPVFVQFGERLRFAPRLPHKITLDYSATLQHYHAVSDSRFSFRRFTLDFNHEIALGKISGPPQGNAASLSGPDEVKDHPAPDFKNFTWNRNGSVGLRAMLVGSVAHAGSAVPFYFQPTLGGTDINGEQRLPSYPDYRFRAPNLILLRASFEHSLPWVFGITAAADVGKAVLNRDDLDLSHLRHSYSAGLTIRAGNLPQVWLTFAWVVKKERIPSPTSIRPCWEEAHGHHCTRPGGSRAPARTLSVVVVARCPSPCGLPRVHDHHRDRRRHAAWQYRPASRIVLLKVRPVH